MEDVGVHEIDAGEHDGPAVGVDRPVAAVEGLEVEESGRRSGDAFKRRRENDRENKFPHGGCPGF